ncbi:MAG: MASE1 domain-containing protein [Gemmatimonadaceae bacterium]
MPFTRTDLLSGEYIGRVAAVGLLYVLAARAGLTLDAVSGFASLVWPPTGIALAAVLLAGQRMWPGIFVGALGANVLTGASVLAAAGIATGNTLEAIAAAYALRRFADFKASLDSLRDVLALIVFAAILSTTISATLGVTSLYLAGMVAPATFAETWRTWWIGDAIGALLVAPLILVWANRRSLDLSATRLVEAALLLLSLVLTSLLLFIVPVTREGGPLGAYVFFPLLMWAAIRFGQRGAVTATVLVSAIAVAGTVMRQGPFIEPTLHESLLALQTFIGIAGATFLVLGASISERERFIDELGTARDVARAANRAKAEFLAVMSHELRTPLNAIAGYSELLTLGVSGPLTEKQIDSITRIRSNQQHLLSLIDDVLSFAKIEAGNTKLTTRPLCVCEALDSLEPLVRPELMRRELTFVWDGCDATWEVLGDPMKLRQIMLNILGNAMKFTPAQGRIEMSARRSGDSVVVQVADTGIGIPAQQIEQVFEPFFQVQAGMTREYPGVGLGLAISRDFARAMGGDILIESPAGGGTVVSVRLLSAS